MAGWRSFALLVCLLGAACASTAEPVAPLRPTSDPAARVRVADLAARNGLAESYEVRRNRLTLAGESGRVLLFPGTTVAVVNGVSVPDMKRIGGTTGDFSVTVDDARKIETALIRARPRVAAAPLPPPATKKRNPSLRPAGPHAAEAEAGWKVPLRRNWRWIVIHHSGTTSGSAASFGQSHLDRGWEGLGYDFVIGNGKGTGDGQVEVGYRWTQQQTGAHAGRASDGSNLMNESGIGVCLVGNFNQRAPTAAQLHALRRLVAFLSSYCGIPPENVLVHRDVRGTDCPGRHFPTADFLVPSRNVPASFR